MKTIFLKMVCIMLTIFIISSQSYCTTYIYDELNRLKEVTYETGQKLTYQYDSSGNITNTTTSFTQKLLMSIEFEQDTYNINIGDIVPLQIVGTYSDGTSSSVTEGVVYSSSSPTIASIDEAGTARGLSYGETVITAVYDSISIMLTLTVSSPNPTPTPTYIPTPTPAPNLLINPEMNVDYNLNGRADYWYGYANAGATNYAIEDNSQKVWVPNTVNTGNSCGIYQEVAASEGEMISVGFGFRNEVASGSGKITVVVIPINSAGVGLSPVWIKNYDSSSEWTQGEIESMIMPQGTVKVRMHMGYRPSGAGGSATAWFKDAVLMKWVALPNS
jgi:YD repeat-containing protein